MSPEQAVGDPSIDQRADIYSFGCLAYELLAGRPPFSGRDAVQLVVAHVHGNVTPVSDLRSDTPAALAAIVDRCLDKNRANRPQTARDILQMLDSLSTSSGAVAAGSRRAFSGRVIAGAIVIAAIAAAVAARSHFVADDSGSPTLAVMPFTNVGGDTSQEYFADGIAIDLTNALSRVPGLRVASRSLAFTYQGKRVDVRSVGRDLHVGTVLEGTVQRSGRRVRVTSQLTRTADGFSLWSNTYERDAEDLFGIQDTIAKSIANELRLAFAPTSTARPTVAGTTNLAAYDSYLRGVYLLEHRGAGVSEAIKFFKDAVARDSGLARGYGTLSEALELIPYFSPTPAATVEAEALGAAQRALALDSTVVDAHVGLALAREHASRWAEAEAEYRLALALDPNSATVHLQYGRHLMALGRIGDAMKEYQRATTLDPASGTAFVWLAHMLSLSGARDSALAVGRHARELDPGLVLARTYGAVDAARAGRRDLAEGLAWGIEGSPPWIGIAAFALAATGETTAARARLRDLEHLPRDTWLLHTGLAYAELGLADTTRALADLELALRSREITPKWATFSDPIYDAVRNSARFAAIVRGFGLDDRVLTSPLGGRPAR
jgi:serine/threonine-protein kinase